VAESALLYPASFSPDGIRLAFRSFETGKDPKAMEVGVDRSSPRTLARDADEPIYSPDGAAIAYLRGPIRQLRRHSRPTRACSRKRG
jgi:Tol biopolymer transport system component